jgi:long-chain acyl-CoA synthetase
MSLAEGPPALARVDELLSRASARYPDAVALRACDGTELTYAALDDQVSACAAVLRDLAGGPGTVIALSAVLDPAFAVAFFGIARSGNVITPVGPLLREDGLAHVIAAAGASLAIVPPDAYPLLARVTSRLPTLRTVVLTSRGDGEAARLPVLSELIAGSPARLAAPAGRDSVACVQFTNGTTGPPKGVRLSHGNLTVNAAQTAWAHRLSESSVLLNALPVFHMMHLTAGVAAAATHVLAPPGDPVAAVRLAAAAGATHYYSLPVLLARLAADPRLTGLRAPSLRGILSGGSAIAPEVRLALAEHFGVPVVQGYGLAEASPLTHCDLLEAPRPGSCGPPVAGTECRIVDVDSGVVLPPGGRGEVQVRGPQLMLGYLGRERALDLAEGGWLRTGDVGYTDQDGYLFLVDRIKDVFKCDNYLVSPTQIEAVLRQHPMVADCAVVDQPDRQSGAVACGVVVPAGDGLQPQELIDFVAARLPYYEQVRRIEVVDALPRTANGGKVMRRELREWLWALSAAEK